MTRYIVLMTLLHLPGLLSAAPELKGEPEELANYLLDGKRVVSIAAHGQSKVQADRAIVSLRVKTKDGAFAQALKSNREVRSKLSHQLQQAGIAPERIAAGKFSSLPNYGFFGNKPSSYEISNEVSVVVRSEDDMAVIAQAVDGMKEVSYLATQFEDSNKKIHEGGALDDALGTIALKKSAYEKALGIKLAPLRISESTYQHAPAGQGMAKFAARSAMQTLESSESAPGDDGSGSAGGFGELRYETDVNAEYLVQTR